MKIHVHGRGNAWPVPLGQVHPFYDRCDYRDLANAAFSLEISDSDVLMGEVLVDAGHGTIQSLIAGANRIPHCICLTHGHMDHTLSVDWVVQSFWRQHQGEKKYPIYASKPVFRFLIQSYPHLEGLVDFIELYPGVPTKLKVEGDFFLTGYPVYHGPAAMGASMLLFEHNGKRILFTGDLFSPLLREEDYRKLHGVDTMVVDCNNRFPWPRTNHWSFAGHPDFPEERSEALKTFLNDNHPEHFTAPHLKEGSSRKTELYLDQVMQEWSMTDQPFTILEFVKRLDPGRVFLVHYSGAEDQIYYSEPQLSEEQLIHWVKETAKALRVRSEFIIPRAGEEMIL